MTVVAYPHEEPLLRVAPEGTSESASDSHAGLPSPPRLSDKYAYMGRQHRWLPFVQAISFSLIAYSIARFSLSNAHLLPFLIPMSLYAVGMVVSLLSSTRTKETSREQHEALVGFWHQRNGRERHPSVDVFLPTAGEPLEVLANTYRYVGAMQWAGRLRVYVLDDGARPEVRELAEGHGFSYATRPDRGYLKKAGNLRFGYDQSDGDIIAIFDADFAPRDDYLDELVPYFDDRNVGIVQSPQYFDTTKRMGWVQRSAGATQELFYRFIQPARDRSGAAICVGTCALYRRAALARAGGFAQIGHSEDVHTGVNLLRVGYRVRYVPIIVSKGLCPDTMISFLNQQYRWCTGSMSLLADQSFHNNPYLGWRRRICFWSGFLYYISTAINAFAAPLPALVMVWVLPGYIQPRNSMWLVGALLLWFVVMPCVMHGRWRVEVLRIQWLYSFAHAVAILHLLTGRTKEWVATGAKNKRTPLAVNILRIGRGYSLVTLTAILVGLGRGIAEYGIARFWAVTGFALLAAYIQVPLLLTRAGGRAPKPAPSPAGAEVVPPLRLLQLAT